MSRLQGSPTGTGTTRDLVFVALFAALVVVLGLVPPLVLPVVAVPVTAQTLGVMLAGSVLGARRAGLALLLFLALVLVGLPVLAGGRGGLGVLLGPSGGFLLGFPLGAAAVGWLTERVWRRYDLARAVACNVLGGVCAVYAVGIPWLAVVSGVDLWTAAAGSAVFLPGDAVKVAVASVVAVNVRHAYPLIPAGDPLTRPA